MSERKNYFIRKKYFVWLKIQLKIEFTLMLLRTRDKSTNRNELRRWILNNSGADILGIDVNI